MSAALLTDYSQDPPFFLQVKPCQLWVQTRQHGKDLVDSLGEVLDGSLVVLEAPLRQRPQVPRLRVLLVRIHFIIVMIRRTGLAPWCRNNHPTRKHTHNANVVLEAPLRQRPQVPRLRILYWLLRTREFKLPWCEAGPPYHHNDQVDSDQ